MVNYSIIHVQIIHVQTLLYHNSQNLGIHTFAVLRGTENYEVLRDGLKPVIDEINELIDKGSVVLSNKRVVDVNIFLGGDYKVFTEIETNYHFTCIPISVLIDVYGPKCSTC